MANYSFQVINGHGRVLCEHAERRDATAACKDANKKVRATYPHVAVPGDDIFFVKKARA